MMTVAHGTVELAILKYQFGIGEHNYCTSTDQHAWPDKAALLQSVWSMALHAMTVECEQFIYLFIVVMY